MSEQSIIDAAKAPSVAYGTKDWNAVRASMAPGVVYDEVATHRRVQGADQMIGVWQGWATAFPDSKASFERAAATGNTVVLELTWRGTHRGPLTMPEGPIAPTGKTIEIRACQIVEVADGKVRSITHYFDIATMLQQLGVSSRAASAH